MPKKAPVTIIDDPRFESEPNYFISLDVSSTAFGYAWFEMGDIAAFGVLRAKDKSPVDRLVSLFLQARQLVANSNVSHIVVERWSGLRGRGRMSVNAATIMGASLGVVAGVAAVHDKKVIAILETEWTKRKQKEDRAKYLASVNVAYAAARAGGNDEGGDAADAIMLGEYFLRRCRESALLRLAMPSNGKKRRTK